MATDKFGGTLVEDGPRTKDQFGGTPVDAAGNEIAAPKRGAIRSLADTAVAAGRGVATGVKMTADAFGANNAVSRAAGSTAEAIGGLDSEHAKYQRAVAAQRTRDAEATGSGFEEFKAGVQNFADRPIDAIVEGLGSSLPTIGAIALSRGRINPAAAGAGVGAVQGSGAVKGQIYDEVKGQHEAAGASPELAEQQAQRAQAYRGPNTDQIALGAGLGAVAGSTGLESGLSRILSGAGKKGIIKSIGAGMAKEGSTEFVQGGQEKLAGNIAAQREGFDVPTMQGVIGQGTEEGLAGGAPGGIVGAVEGFGARRQAAREQALATLADPNAGALSKAAATGELSGANEEKQMEVLRAAADRAEEARAKAAKGKPLEYEKTPLPAAPGPAEMELADENAVPFQPTGNPDLAKLQEQVMQLRAQGEDFTILRHGDGGYKLAPTAKLLKVVKNSVKDLQPAVKKSPVLALPGPSTAVPSGEVIADAAGKTRQETYGDRLRAKRDELATKRRDMGESVPHGPNKRLLPLTADAAAKRAAGESGRTQKPHTVVPHPTVAGKFAVVPESIAAFDEAAHAAATSPKNDLPEPTQAQKDAGNYKVGKTKLHGLDISIENPAGSTRKGVDKSGKPWENKLAHHYGYIRRTEGADGDHVDAFVGSNLDSDRVFIVDQIDPDTGKFDEHKVLFGFDSIEDARKGYASNYAKGWKGGKDVSETSVEGFKAWLKDGDTKKPYAKNPQAAAGSDPAATAGSSQPAPADMEQSQFNTRADANAAVIEAATATGKVHEVIERADGKFEVRAVKENGDAGNDRGRSDRTAAGNEPADGKRPDGDRYLAGEGRTDAAQPGPKTGSDPAAAGESADSKPALKDRRQDAERRKAVDEMSPQEMRQALLVDEMTGLGNRRAYNESKKKAVQSSIDIDSLKWVNDNLGHDAGDKLIQSLGQALRDENVDAYHLSGDEFAAQFDNEADGHEALARVRDRLKNAVIRAIAPDGTVITKTGVEFSYGLAKTIADADTRLREDKAAREAAGQRAGRGAEPAGVGKEAPAGKQDSGRDTAAEEEVAPTQGRGEFTNSSARDSSWVIKNKATGEVIMETFDRKKVDVLNTEKYEAIPIGKHLASLSKPEKSTITPDVKKPAEKEDIHDDWEKAKQIIHDAAKARPFDNYDAVRDDVLAQIKKQTGKNLSDFEESRGSMMRDPLSEAIHDGQYEGMQDYAATLPVRISESAIPMESAVRAFSGTSFSPEKRGASVRRSYFREVVGLWRRFEKEYSAAPEDRKTAFVDAFNDAASRYAGLTNAYLSSHSNVMSAMIAGPAKFPTERNRKRSDAADKRAAEANEYLGKATKRLAKVLAGPVDNSLSSELVQAEKKLADREKTQDQYKAINAALRKGDDAALRAMGISDAAIAELKKPDFAGRTGIADYQLKNNNAEIRRMRGRVDELKRRAADAAESNSEQQETESAGVRMVRNAEANRLQLFFDGKPEDQIREKLKGAGFHWAPSTGAWQRQLTDNAVAAAERIMKDVVPSSDTSTDDLLGDIDTDTIEIDGVQRSRTNSEGNPISYTTAGLRDFWTWFGADGVADSDGRPLVHSHSSNNGKIDSIDPNKGNFGGIFVLPTYSAGYGKHEHKVYLKGPVASTADIEEFLRNVDDGGKAIFESVLRDGRDLDDGQVDAIAQAVIDEGWRSDSYPDAVEVWEDGTAYALMQKIRGRVAAEAGFGAVAIEDEFARDTLLVTNGTNIKSVDNIGTWNGNDPRIMYDAGPRATSPQRAFDLGLYAAIASGSSSRDILAKIAAESKSSSNRELAQALIDAGISPKIEIGRAQDNSFTVKDIPKGSKFAAGYSPKRDAVLLFTPAGAEKHSMHEFVHAATFKALRKGGINAFGMKALYNHVKKAGGAEGAYGMSNFDEFTAEALSNPEFQAQLRAIKKMPEGSKFKNAWEWFVDLVRRALKLPSKTTTALDQALRYGRGLMGENPDGPGGGRDALAGDVGADSILGDISSTTDTAMGNGIKSTVLTDLPKKAGNRLKDFRSMALQALGGIQILDIYGKDFKPAPNKTSILEEYNTLARQMYADKNESGAEADSIADRWGKLKDERQLAELMHDATLAQIDPAKEYQPGDNRIQWSALKHRLDALSPEAKELYQQARDAYTSHWMKVRTEIRNRIERSIPESPRRAALLSRMDDDFFKKVKGVYFPLARFGDYVVTVNNAAGERVSVTFAETTNEAENLRAELMKQFPKSAGNTVSKITKRREYNASRDAVGRGFLQELFGVLDQSDVGEELQDAINQLYLTSLPDLSWAKHGIHRKGTPGFSQDARRAFAQNMFHGARYLAKLRYADRMADRLMAMQDHVDSKINDEDYDSVAGQNVVDEMTKRHDAIMNPNSSQLASSLTSLGFVFYLGLSPASAVVNLSQTPLVAYPIMAAKYGWSKAGAALLVASKETAGNRNDISKVIKGDELRAYEQAVKSGVIDVSLAHDLAGIAAGDDTMAHAKLRPVMKWASFMFHHAERFNRQATFMAAYRLAKGTGQDHAAAYESAVNDTYAGHFDYSSGNRPRIMQGNVARVLLLFKQYSQNIIYTMSRQAYLAAKGDKTAQKTIAGLLLSHTMAAGVLGLPVVGTLLAIASAIGSDEDEPWDAKAALRNSLADAIGKKPAEVMAHGLSRLTPWDVSGRLGLDRLLLPDVQEGLEGGRAAEQWMAGALGPMAGIGINAAKGLHTMAEGDYGRGLEAMLPSVLRGAVKALRYANEGIKDKTGVILLDDTTALEELGQAMGFAPSRSREATEGKGAVYRADRTLMDRRQSLMTQWSHARMAGDNESASEIQQDIKRFNEKNPNRHITILNLNQSLKNRLRRIREAENGVYLPSKRRDVQDMGRFANDD